MKIGIDARMYGSQQAGLGRYVEQLVLGLVEQDKENEYILFAKDPSLILPLSRGGNFKIVKVNIPWYSWQEQIKFKKIIDQEKIDLMHFPHWNVPLLYNKPFVVTVHDLIMYHYPRQEASTHGPVVYWLKDLVHRIVLRHAVRRAQKIIVTCEFTKQDINQTLGVPLEKMVVSYQAPFERNKEQGVRSKNELERFKINKPYVLYVGNAYPHKNLAGLLKAWKIFEEKYSGDYQLVLVGKNNFFYQKILCHCEELQSDEAITVKQGIATPCSGRARNDSVIFTDYLSDSDLVEVYQHASLYVFPSLYEGFGLPPLEAQQYNVPVVSSSASCLPEILGESVLYFDPNNYEQMADVINIGLTDENIRFELQKNAKENLQRFSWDKLVKETVRVYLSCSKGF
ncbi:MAG: glycosyl transferase, group 1 [Candidatus Magasanikbacteria bacterium GW2011_GWC2_37_14]|uniref:Glycosyl transferase, group 1 n=1 Tax=Candidatus Magasanikbacteria bacterium GW2011_GWC2_37_14 TaxID=1619046 RepID=A0A0G0JH05_9BACT|nr:MAG: glycosyl transferase, group 1 [Candidatus Magasanikbacteria bacterium GW2011_GWC2_37_14]